MSGKKTEKRDFWYCLDKLIDFFDDIFSGRTYSDYEIYGEGYERF